MTIRLSSEMAECLNALAQKSGTCSQAVTKIGDGLYQLNVPKEEAIDLISDEFSANGLGPDDEPNARGLFLEELLDRVNNAHSF